MQKFTSRLKDDSGAALASALMVLVLLAGVTAGVTALVITDTRVRALDGTRTQAFYAVHGALEQLTADLGDLFAADYSPSGAQINALSAGAPTNLGAVWQEPDGTNGYRVTFPAGAGGDPAAQVMTVLNGPFSGLVGLATPYQMTVTGRLPDGSEASLTRTVQTVAIPVFQFGLFSENDLSFFAGPNFDFGGRVHSNSSIFLASGNGSVLTLRDRVTAVNEVIRTNLSNGWAVGVNYTGTVNMIRAPATFRPLATNEASLVGTLGSPQNEPTWTNISTGTYNHYIENGRTGARRLDLPVVAAGAAPIDLVRRPAVGEDVANPDLLEQRYFRMASLRILLSDTAADISNLPTVTATAPVPLGALMPAGYAGAPFALSTNNAAIGDRMGAANLPLLGGFIKMEMQTMAGAWQDVTLEILNLGIAGRKLPDPATGAPNCGEPYVNAIVRLQRVWDTVNGAGACQTAAQLAVATNHVPNVLYDTREGVQRDGTVDTDPLRFGGIMHYIEIDVRNLSRWFQGNLAAVGAPSGANAENTTGYVLYFSDRRTNRNAANQETGEYGFEDIVNPASLVGAPNGVLDVGEDFNGNNVLDTYGQNPQLVAGMLAPLNAAARPWTNVDPGNALAASVEQGIARRNRPIFFRRGLKLVNGGLGNIVLPGLAVVSENPVYVQGHWNANAAGFGNPHAATAVLADAVSFLSGAWNDRLSFTSPHNAGNRNATTTWYRLAIISGKGLSFPQPIGTPQDYGTDGGAHNFLRYLEDWGGQGLNYRGSIVSLFASRQGNGTYKCCADVYAPPTRGYQFDTEFLTPSLLPPKTPMFRDINATGFAQLIRPR
jgi:hypothetical protein